MYQHTTNDGNGARTVPNNYLPLGSADSEHVVGVSSGHFGASVCRPAGQRLSTKNVTMYYYYYYYYYYY